MTAIRRNLALWFATIGLTLVAGLAGCSDTDAQHAPTIVSTQPSDGLVDVPVNTNVAVLFDSPMSPFDAEHFSLHDGSTPVAGTITTSDDGRTLTFDPEFDLAPGVMFEGVVRAGATSLGGRTLASDYHWFFTTGVEPDVSSPQVSSTWPPNAMTGVATNQALLITFSESMDPSTITVEDISLRMGETPIAGIVAYSGITATFTPNEALAPNTNYTGEVGSGATDLAGNAIEDDYAWSFTTGDSPDLTVPAVIANTPSADAVDVALNQRVSITFSEPMAPTSVTGATFTLRAGATPIIATITYSGTSGVLAPWELLAANTEYTVTLSTGATDLAGNAIQGAYEWRFTTGSALDTSGPLVASTIPATNAAVDVPIAQTMSITFSEPMSPTSITAATFTLRRGTTPIISTITYLGVTAELTPSEALAYNTEYTLTMSTGAVDLAGNALASAHEWSFRTAQEPDAIAPAVLSSTPLADAVGVEIDVAVSVTFSEPMAGATLNAASLTLRRGSVPVAATVTYAGVVAALTPWELLEYDTEYTVTLSTAVTDLAGNALQSAREWRFTTGSALDTTPPLVVSTIPVNDALAVGVGQNISVIFNEQLDPATINAASMALMRGSTPIAGAVSYSGVTAVFDPSVNLSPSTTYRVVVAQSVTDLAGNSLASAFSWSFTTSDSVELVPPTVVANTPSADAVGVPLNQRVTITFSEPMAPTSVTATTFTLRAGAVPVAATITYSGVSGVLAPWQPLAANTEYTATLSTGATDLAGNALQSAHEWRFKTGSALDTTRPLVALTIPINNAVAVEVGQSISAIFSEQLDPATINAASMTLMRGSTPVAAIVSYAGMTAVLSPSVSLLPSTTYRIVIAQSVTDLAGNSLASAFTWSFTTSDSVELVSPTVVANTPSADAVGVPLNQRVTITFSEPMAPTSVTAATFTLRADAVPVAATITYSGVSGVLTPWQPLAANTEYTATLSTGATDLAGNAIQSAYEWRFTTGSALDTTRPLVASTIPINNAVAVDVGQSMSATFSEKLDPATINAASMTLMRGTTPVAAFVSYAGLTAVLRPFVSLLPSTTYRIVIAQSVTDLAGNSLASAFAWNFTTNDSVELVPPTVVANTPSADAIGVPLNQRVTLTFSEPMAPTSVTAATFTLRAGAVPVAATVTYSGVSGVLAPWEPLAANTEYTATLSTGATDLAGNALQSAYEWRFKTGSALDTIRPLVASTIPINNAVAVELGQSMSATFSEKLDPATINAASMTLMRGTTPVAAVVSYAGLTAVLDPSVSLLPSTTYRVVIAQSVTDLAGNSLASAFSWSFTSGEAADTEAPTVVSTVPGYAAVGVPLEQKMSITFSEPMAPTSVTAATYTLRAGATPVAATVTYSGISGVLTPWEPLAENTVYTATLSTGATDLAGNAMESAYEWRFTTGSAPDTTRPVVVSTIPANNALAVDIGQNISAIFSEKLAPATVNSASMTLMRGSTPVAGTVTYSGVTAVFDPSASLVAGSVYQVTIAATVTDLAGNSLASAFGWSFTAGVASETVPPTVVSTVPGYGAANVPIGQRMSITFSEPMAPASISAATFTLRSGTMPIVSTVTYLGVTAELIPWGTLSYDTEYTLTMSTGATDLAGNPLASAHEWRFRTAIEPDTTAPTVVSSTPLAGVIDAEITTAATVTFSEPMAGATLNTTSLTMRRGSVPVTATVTYAGVVATLVPWEPLAYETEYTVTLSTAATDLAGNALQSAREWRFTTRVEPDIIAPTVVTTVPAHLAANVEINIAISATFSEALAPATVTNTSMTLFRGATAIAANVTYAGLTATLMPLVPLEYETEYTVAFGPNVADLAGNKLLDASNWQFTTRVAPDIIAPQVVSTTPASGAVGAATNQGVVAMFTEPMLVASVNTSSFRVTDRLLAAVPGTVTLDATGMVATFTPTHDLVRGSTYHVALSVALTDVAGNPLAAALAWDFKTAAGPAPVSLGTAANYVILARTGIATTGVSDVTGNMGLSPGVDAVLAGWGQSAATSFSTSPMVDGFIYVSTYDAPTPAKLVLASTDMGAAYSAVAAQGPPDAVGLNAGALGGVTFAPGIYKWNAAATIATNATMQGGPNDVWVFQVNGALAMAASVSIVLSGGARAENVFWQVNGAINIGATSHFVGIALASTAINVGAGSSVNGRLLAQTAVAVDTCEIGITP